MKTLAIFASGGGTNARKILEHLKASESLRVGLVVSNNPEAGVLKIAEDFSVPVEVVQRSDFYKTENMLTVLKHHEIDWVILAGFLWLIPPYLLQAFPEKIINIHPALLPKYGGKGMYGHHVHEAVKAANETETGITIHFANEHYDQGDIIFQARCTISPADSPADIAHKVLMLEHQHFPKVIEQVICGM